MSDLYTFKKQGKPGILKPKGNYSLIMGAFLCLLITQLACRETPLPEEMVGEVVFYAEGTLDGEPLSLEAGKEEYYMKSSYAQDAQGILTYQGTFNRPNCTDCGEELLIEISNGQVLQVGENPNIEEALKVGSYAYRNLSNVSDVFVVDFVSEFGGRTRIDSAEWDFGDGEGSMMADPQHTYIDPPDSSPKVCFRTVDENGCVSLICNEVNLDSAICKVDFTYTIDESTGFVSFFDQSEGVYPLEHRWNFGDGFGASLGNPGYYLGRRGSFEVCLTVTDATGCRRTLCKNVGTDPASCNSNFSYAVNKVAGPLVPQLSRVLVQWTDAEGKVYRSDLEEQEAASRFEILASASYKPNEKGEATRKLDLRFACKVYAEDGTSLNVDISDAVVAVAHP